MNNRGKHRPVDPRRRRGKDRDTESTDVESDDDDEKRRKLDAELAAGELRRKAKRLASQPDNGYNDKGTPTAPSTTATSTISTTTSC